MLEYLVPEDDDITKPYRVKKANPASWITKDALREQREAIAEVAYRRYHCNQWTAQVGAWLPAGAWQACAGDVSFTDGERIWVGVDVGGERSASAVVYVNENLHVGVRCGRTTARGLRHDHRRRASQIRGDTICHLCGQPGSWQDPVDPLTADHVTPRAELGRHSELRPAHRSCNSRRAARSLA